MYKIKTKFIFFIMSIIALILFVLTVIDRFTYSIKFRELFKHFGSNDKRANDNLDILLGSSFIIMLFSGIASN